MERSHKKLKGVLRVALSTSARNGDGVTFTHARISDAEIKVRTVMQAMKISRNAKNSAKDSKCQDRNLRISMCVISGRMLSVDVSD